MTDSTASMQIHDELGERRHAAGRSIAPVGEPATLTGLQLQDRATIYRTDRMRPEVDAYRDVPAEYRRMVETAMKGLPDTAASLTALMKTFTADYGVDGLFTDNPDLFPR